MIKLEDDYMVLDCETTVKAKKLKNKAHFAHPDNYIVLLCGRSGNEVEPGISMFAGTKEDCMIPSSFLRKRLLVGHNIKFDLLYLLKFSNEFRENFHHYRVWDTAHVEYLLSGQSCKFPSLDDVSAKYGLPPKPDAVKVMWDAGMETEDIPIETLYEYCAGHDVPTTHRIFHGQLEQLACNSTLARLVESQMLALQALTHMEFTGMYVDTERLSTLEIVLKDKLESSSQAINTVARDAGFPDGVFNANSRHHLNYLFFGGTLKHELREQIGVYGKGAQKAGQPKFSVKEIPIKIKGLAEGKLLPVLDKAKDGTFKLDDEALIQLGVHSSELYYATSFIRSMRAYEKELNTYVEGYKKHVYPITDGCGVLFPNFNTTATSTGRLSSSNPNMQNTSNKDASED